MSDDVTDPPKKQPLVLLSKKEVCRRVGLSFPTIWKMMQMQRDEFPRSYQVGGKTMWIEAEIDTWIMTRPLRPYKGDGARKKN